MLQIANVTWRDLKIEKEIRIATRGKGEQGKALSLNFMPRERFKKMCSKYNKMLISLLSPWHILLLPPCYYSMYVLQHKHGVYKVGIELCLYQTAWDISYSEDHQASAEEFTSLLYGSKVLAEGGDLPWPTSHGRPESLPGKCSPAPCVCVPCLRPHGFHLSPTMGWSKPSLAR